MYNQNNMINMNQSQDCYRLNKNKTDILNTFHAIVVLFTLLK